MNNNYYAVLDKDKVWGAGDSLVSALDNTVANWCEFHEDSPNAIKDINFLLDKIQKTTYQDYQIGKMVLAPCTKEAFEMVAYDGCADTEGFNYDGNLVAVL